MKTCTKCQESKALEDFYKDGSRPDGRCSQCAACEKARMRLYRQTDEAKAIAAEHWRKYYPDKRTRIRNSRLVKKYGITLEDRDFMIRAQGGRCAVCPSPFVKRDGAGRGPQIDHDHNCCDRPGSCGRCLRGILCFDCNGVVGKIENGWDVDVPAINRYIRLYS